MGGEKERGKAHVCKGFDDFFWSLGRAVERRFKIGYLCIGRPWLRHMYFLPLHVQGRLFGLDLDFSAPMESIKRRTHIILPRAEK